MKEIIEKMRAEKAKLVQEQELITKAISRKADVDAQIGRLDAAIAELSGEAKPKRKPGPAPGTTRRRRAPATAAAEPANGATRAVITDADEAAEANASA